MDVELEAVGAERETVIERGHRVLWRECAAAAVREYERPRRTEKCMPHRDRVYTRSFS